jgi:hypothetical protein
MCEFCMEHGEGLNWYLDAKNYGEDLLSDRPACLPPPHCDKSASANSLLFRVCDFGNDGVNPPHSSFFGSI